MLVTHVLTASIPQQLPTGDDQGQESECSIQSQLNKLVSMYEGNTIARILLLIPPYCLCKRMESK